MKCVFWPAECSAIILVLNIDVLFASSSALPSLAAFRACYSPGGLCRLFSSFSSKIMQFLNVLRLRYQDIRLVRRSMYDILCTIYHFLDRALPTYLTSFHTVCDQHSTVYRS